MSSVLKTLQHLINVKVAQNTHFHIIDILRDRGWFDYQTVIDANGYKPHYLMILATVQVTAAS
jgi:hypothetical protein